MEQNDKLIKTVIDRDRQMQSAAFKLSLTISHTKWLHFGWYVVYIVIDIKQSTYKQKIWKKKNTQPNYNE